MGCATAWGRASTCRMGGHACIRAGPATTPKMAYRHNCAGDADAVALGCATGWGQSAWDAQRHWGRAKKLCHQQVLDTTLLQMEMQLHMGCATVLGRASTDRMEMHTCIRARRTTMPKTGCRNNRAQDADAIAHGMHNHMAAGPAPAARGGAPVSGQG